MQNNGLNESTNSLRRGVILAGAITAVAWCGPIAKRRQG